MLWQRRCHLLVTKPPRNHRPEKAQQSATTAATTTATLTLSFFFMVGDAHEWWFIRVGCAFDYGEREALEAENSFKVTC